jgi:hypothetical protein
MKITEDEVKERYSIENFERLLRFTEELQKQKNGEIVEK